MNLHVPQTIEAEVEIMVNSRCAAHIVSAQRNAPVNGIVQDGLVASYILTMEWEGPNPYTKAPGHKLNNAKPPYLTMVKGSIALSIYKDAEIPQHRIDDLMIRAQKVYPQYITNGTFTEYIPGALFMSILFSSNFCYNKVTEIHVQRPEVIIEDGIIMPNSSPLCVKSVGGKGASIIHVLWKISPEIALYFISDLQQITDRWLVTHGFTIGIRDCFASNENEVAKVLIETRMKVDEIIKKNDTLERTEMAITNELNNVMNVGPTLAKNSMNGGDRNALNIMRNSGAKGSLINLVQITAFVGQQNIRGRRLPKQLSHGSKCLPSHLPNDLSPEAGGFVQNNYLRGLRPDEAFAHAAGGREGVIATALKSVTGETPIVIIDHTGNSKYVLIGDWIDGWLSANADNVEHYAEREMELLDVEEFNMSIPTADEFGNVSWGLIKNITRHDPGKELYEIKTLGGRHVIVTESKSLLIWDESVERFCEKPTPDVKIGDFVPVTMNLPEPPVINDYIDISRYLPKNEYVYGSDFILAETEMNKAMIGRTRIPAGWWQQNNGKTFTLPYTKKSSLTRTCSGRSNTEAIKEGCVYPYSAMRGNMEIPDKLKLNEENGIFIGLFLAEGNVDIKSGYIQITNANKNIQSFVEKWFDRLCIKHVKNVKITDLGTTEDIRGYSTILAKLLTYMVGHGARNKYVPDEAFTAPEEFIIGLLNGYFSGDGCVSDGGITVCSASKRLITGINILLSRLGVFGKVRVSQQKSNNLGTLDIAPMNNISIRGQWAKIFANKIDMVDDGKHAKLQELKPSKKHINFPEQNDVVRDKIVEINKVDIKDYPKVYDLTIPSTLNFGVANGLICRDTAETGYMQKKIARKVEDFIVWIDGTVRNANGRVISFMYGDDGMDSKKLVSVKGLDTPFFVNPTFIAKQLNSDAQSLGELMKGEKMRCLKPEEVKLLLTFIYFSGIKSPVIQMVTDNTRKTLADVIKDVKIYPSKIPDFFDNIRDIYISSKASYGLAAGLIAASSLGEPGTQMVLNVFHYAGIKGKDASSGVPRYKELNNATKTKDQKKPSCEIWLNDVYIQNTAKKIRECGDSTTDEITKIKGDMFEYIQHMKAKFEETNVGNFITDHSIKYIAKNVDLEVNTNGMGILCYEKYDINEWWVKLYKDLYTKKGEERIEPESWVVIFYFNVEKLYRFRLDLGDIAKVIESKSKGAFRCVVSPTFIGQIHVYLRLQDLKIHAGKKLGILYEEEEESESTDDEEDENTEGEEEEKDEIFEVSYTSEQDTEALNTSLVNENNVEYFVCRDVVVDFIKKIQVSGIKGITKIYPREDKVTHEYVIDTDGINFLDILTAPDVDSTKTTCDDMHSIRTVLGIEATRTFIFEEFTRVISFDGTYVNPRHTAMLCDAMTVNGSLDAASRDGISREDAGPNAKIMFEKNIDNAAVASAFSENDVMTSLASSVMYGKLARVGSGSVIIRDKDRMK
jgi:DNA-directed RNA polymerase beta' subunit